MQPTVFGWSSDMILLDMLNNMDQDWTSDDDPERKECNRLPSLDHDSEVYNGSFSASMLKHF